jgi:hypothetical protein
VPRLHKPMQLCCLGYAYHYIASQALPSQHAVVPVGAFRNNDTALIAVPPSPGALDVCHCSAVSMPIVHEHRARSNRHRTAVLVGAASRASSTSIVHRRRLLEVGHACRAVSTWLL